MNAVASSYVGDVVVIAGRSQVFSSPPDEPLVLGPAERVLAKRFRTSNQKGTPADSAPTVNPSLRAFARNASIPDGG